jgi:uncharacterized membrane protein YfcA
MTGAFLIVTAFFTALLSGIIGMAGGLILMGALALVLPVSAAFVTHGLLQLVANGWRAVLHRRHVAWAIVGWYALASLIAAVVVLLVGYSPSKPLVFLLLGLVPMLVWLPRKWIRLDAAKSPHALISGFMVTGLNLHQIVATKATTQVFSHLAKVAVYGAPLIATRAEGMPPLWVFVFAFAVPLSMLGTVYGGWVLDRISDVNFKRWTAWIVTAVGLLYLAKAAQAW